MTVADLGVATDYSSRQDIARIRLTFGESAFQILAKSDVDKTIRDVTRLLELEIRAQYAQQNDENLDPTVEPELIATPQVMKWITRPSEDLEIVSELAYAPSAINYRHAVLHDALLFLLSEKVLVMRELIRY